MTAGSAETPTYAVVGSGYMGGGIAQVLALSGAQVVLADVSEEVARANYERLLKESDDFVRDDLFPAGATALLEKNLRPAASIEEAVETAVFIEEAVPEVVDIKGPTLARISAAARPDAVIGSNTSTISIGRLAEFVTEPSRFLGVHFSNPAPFIPGVELIAHASTTETAVAMAERIVRATGKQTARIGDHTGFVLNRLQYALFSEASRLADEGVASVEDIDTVVRTTFGFRLPFFGPFAIADMAGLDVYKFCYESLQTDIPDRYATPPRLAQMVDEGHLGIKSGGGYLNIPSSQSAELVAYRNRAYVAMQKLLDELGPAPLS
jgi:3-hydroxybutyryl-CoA dehydrogenase